jgi:hypothetical protein
MSPLINSANPNPKHNPEANIPKKSDPCRVAIRGLSMALISGGSPNGKNIKPTKSLALRLRAAFWPRVSSESFGTPPGYRITGDLMVMPIARAVLRLRAADLRRRIAAAAITLGYGMVDGKRRRIGKKFTAATHGATLHEVKEILGHSQIKLTSDLYSHLFLEAKRKAISKMDEMLGPQNPVAPSGFSKRVN